MILYLDQNYCCHITNDGTMRKIETDVFEGKCATYIEGFRFIPMGESWIRSDGEIFVGEMVVPAVDCTSLEKVQSQYELDEILGWDKLNIPYENNFIASCNYPIKSFIAIQEQLYETTHAIPKGTTISNNNTVKTTIKHYLETLEG